MKKLSCLIVTALALSGIYNQTATAQEICKQRPQVIFVNGILTDEDKADTAAKHLGRAISAHENEIQPGVAFNKTIGPFADLVESLYQKGLTYHERTESVALAIYKATNGSTQLRDSPPGFINEIKFALSRLVAKAAAWLMDSASDYERDLTSHITGYQAALTKAPGLYLVAHSQGSLFVNDAFYLLDANELRGDKRKHSGGYFVAPAAASMYWPFVSEYTKFHTDMLALTHIGLSGNFNFYLNDSEFLEYIEFNIDGTHHGFIESYLNGVLAGADDGIVYSPAHARSYHRIANAIRADLERLAKPCAWKTRAGVNEFFIVDDPLPVRDAAFCAHFPMDTRQYSMMKLSRENCLSAFTPELERQEDAMGNPMPFDQFGVCTTVQGAIVCGLKKTVDAVTEQGLPYKHTYAYDVYAAPTDVAALCPVGQYDLLSEDTGGRSCLSWMEVQERLLWDRELHPEEWE